jgi:hypothetical protein
LTLRTIQGARRDVSEAYRTGRQRKPYWRSNAVEHQRADA